MIKKTTKTTKTTETKTEAQPSWIVNNEPYEFSDEQRDMQDAAMAYQNRYAAQGIYRIAR